MLERESDREILIEIIKHWQIFLEKFSNYSFNELKVKNLGYFHEDWCEIYQAFLKRITQRYPFFRNFLISTKLKSLIIYSEVGYLRIPYDFYLVKCVYRSDHRIACIILDLQKRINKDINSINDFITVFNNIKKSFLIPLNKTELSILCEYIHMKNKSFTEEKKLDIGIKKSKRTICRAKSIFRKYNILTDKIFVNYPLVDLHPFLIKYPSSITVNKPLKDFLLEDISNCFTNSHFNYGIFLFPPPMEIYKPNASICFGTSFFKKVRFHQKAWNLSSSAFDNNTNSLSGGIYDFIQYPLDNLIILDLFQKQNNPQNRNMSNMSIVYKDPPSINVENPRSMEIITYISLGLSYNDIAQILHLSKQYVHQLIRNLENKNIITKYTDVSNIGMSEFFFIFTEGSNDLTGKFCNNFVPLFPNWKIYLDAYQTCCLAIFRCPKEWIPRLYRSLDTLRRLDLFEFIDFGLFHCEKEFIFPYNYWNAEYNYWDVPLTQVNRLNEENIVLDEEKYQSSEVSK